MRRRWVQTTARAVLVAASTTSASCRRARRVRLGNTRPVAQYRVRPAQRATLAPWVRTAARRCRVPLASTRRQVPNLARSVQVGSSALAPLTRRVARAGQVTTVLLVRRRRHSTRAGRGSTLCPVPASVLRVPLDDSAMRARWRPRIAADPVTPVDTVARLV